MFAGHPETLQSALRSVQHLAQGLPSGVQAECVRTSILQLLAAIHECAGVEESVHQLVESLHQFDEEQVGGLRREFQRNAPAVGRLLEVIQQTLLPYLRQAGYRV